MGEDKRRSELNKRDVCAGTYTCAPQFALYDGHFAHLFRLARTC